MEYRKVPRGEEKISVLGVGTSSIGMAEEKEIEAAISLALENGINYFDMASADANHSRILGAPSPASEKMYIFRFTLEPIMKGKIRMDYGFGYDETFR